MTPYERHGAYWVKRDDLFTYAGHHGGKVRTCLALATGGPTPGLVTAGAKDSPQVAIVAAVARTLGLPCRVHVPACKGSPEIDSAAADGAEVIWHAPGRNTVIVARSRADAAARGWRLIPFGMECAEAVTQTAAQVPGLPEGVSRIVIPVGSGMSMAGVIDGLAAIGRPDVRVAGVVTGANPRRRLDTYAPMWRFAGELIPSGYGYGEHVPGRIGGITLDPVYEAKCLPHLRDGDVLWVVGRRKGNGDGQGTRVVDGPAETVGEGREHGRVRETAGTDSGAGG